MIGILTVTGMLASSLQSSRTFRRSALFLCLACLPAVAQQNVQFLPEVDTYLRLNSMFRVYVEAKDDQDGGDSAQAGIGPSVQLYLKPLAKLKTIRAFDLDDAKKRFFVLEAGYRYIGEPDTPTENRTIMAATFNFPMKAGFSMSDRNRADLDWRNGSFTWRYRNKLTVERTVAIRSFHHIPYVAVEPFYESRFNKWSTTALYAGSLFPVGRHVEFNPYYEHENNTGGNKNHPENAVGLALYLFFSLE
ncbi:MAG: DUF2490 domain-containing protein [Candidatus Korobacteraceae bacterium]